jgi:hypothetical protein
VIKFLKEFFLPIWANLGWFLCVFSTLVGMDWLSLLVPAIAWLVLLKQQKNSSVLILVLLAIVGCVFDQLFYMRGFVVFNLHSGALIPLWLVSMWFLFVTMIPTISRFFKNRWLLAVVLGAIMGPLAYKGGEPFNVIMLQQNALIVFAVFWGLYFPSALWLFQRQVKTQS